MIRQRGRIDAVQALIRDSRLRVRLTVCQDDGQQYFAFLPDRELSTLLPRSILLASLREVPRKLLDTIEPILQHLLKGRVVRLWQFEEHWYCSFLPWRPVRFADR